MDLLLHLYCVMYANVVLKTCLFQVAVVFQVAVNDCIVRHRLAAFQDQRKALLIWSLL